MAAAANANNHGGARPGAGRKRKADVHAGAIRKAEKRVADRLPALIDNLFALADGGYERVDEEWAPAGSITIKGPVMTANGPLLNAAGAPVLVEQPAFPGRPPDELVLVKRRVSVADRDRAANVYLLDRVLGRPVERERIALDREKFEHQTTPPDVPDDDFAVDLSADDPAAAGDPTLEGDRPAT